MHIDLGGYHIRDFEDADAGAFAKYANNLNVARNLRDRFPHPYTLDDAVAFIERMRGQDPRVAFAIASPKEAIGGIAVSPFDDVYRKSAEIGFWVAEPFWGQGIATRAVRAMTEWGFAHFDVVRIQACVFAWNPASARVLEKAGYTFEGRLKKSVCKLGEIMDQLVYARLAPEIESEVQG
jgi:RimJ/RimL family protein N-acetyltransferase